MRHPQPSGKPSTAHPTSFLVTVDSRLKRVPCSVYVAGVNWYTHPCYRSFAGPRPTFLAALLLDGALAYAAEKDKNPPTDYSGYAICQACRYGRTTYDSCQTVSCRNFKERYAPKLAKFVSAGLIAALVSSCEAPTAADALPLEYTAHHACNTAPHFRFAVADDGKVTTTLVGVAEAPEPVVVTAEELLRACLVEDDKNGLKLDELMAVYIDKACGKEGGGEDACPDGAIV
ncbi:hypothetical protein HK405_010494 [Cladochytrium tenue]|nr:hypothetical protein HK405_010494 [Cladochytrium tenue]